MLQPHVVDFHIAQVSIAQSLLNRESGIVGVNMNLDKVFIRHNHKGIPDAAEIGAELIFLCLSIFDSIDDKFCTIPEGDALR